MHARPHPSAEGLASVNSICVVCLCSRSKSKKQNLFCSLRYRPSGVASWWKMMHGAYEYSQLLFNTIINFIIVLITTDLVLKPERPTLYSVVQYNKSCSHLWQTYDVTSLDAPQEYICLQVINVSRNLSVLNEPIDEWEMLDVCVVLVNSGER